MIRKLLFASVTFAIGAFAFAQVPEVTLTLAPTTNTDEADAIAKDATEASVEQHVRMILPQATALHLDASTLEFDLTALDGDGWATRAASGDSPDDFHLACVYAAGPDQEIQSGPNLWNQTQVIPGGIAYDAEYADYDNITVTGGEVVNYPPLRVDADGHLIDGSKDYIVCYQSFIIQLFSNFGYWDLQVVRNDKPTNDRATRSIEHLYIQGNVCSQFGETTGLYGLPGDDQGKVVHLIPRDLNAGTTGHRVNENCGNTNTSWLDVLGVMAIKVNSDFHGTSIADLTYTLMSSNSQFP